MKQKSTLHILLLGPPGCGKGTQARLLCKHFDIPQVSTGDMLRAAIAEGGELGRRTEAIINSGALVPDEIIVTLVSDRIAGDDCRAGFLLDGFPRTVQQAEALDRVNIVLSHVLIFEVDDEEIVKRITGRRIHPASGRTYHLISNPPRKPGIDDLSGEPLIRREDDNPDLAHKRLDVYRRQTEPLLDFYKNKNRTEGRPDCVILDGTAGIDTIHRHILDALDESSDAATAHP